MHLMRLEIAGFKSFRDRVILEFSPGITAIVGPNGCGKSNVVDALRWVMGEQKVRFLRGKKLDDIIFYGSEEATPVSLAEVSMVLSRRDSHPFPAPYGDWEEVTIARRHFRDGESEYYLNTIPCRLLDIREFFMGTGVGARTYSVVEQSGINQLIEAKPEERRLFIEEVAGISKYKGRKEAAVKKIETAKQNLLRLNDIIKEVKSQLNTVSRQAKRVEQYRALKANIRENEITLAVHAYRELTSRMARLDEVLNSLREEITARDAELSTWEAELATVKAQLAAEDSSCARLQERLFQHRNDIRLAEQAIEHLSGKIRDTVAQIEGYGKIVADLQARQEASTQGRDKLEQVIEELKSALAGTTGTLEEREREARLKREEEARLRGEIDRIKVGYVDLAAEKARLNNTLTTIGRTLEALTRQKERNEREVERHRHHLGQLRERMHALAGAIGKDEEHLNNLREESRVAAAEEERLRMDLGEAEETITSLKERLSSKSSRLASLKEFHDGYAWCTPATRAVMNSDGHALEGLMTLVADCLAVEPGYERAVESVLGEKLEYVIVKSIDAGVKAIHYLKEAALGRGHFVPLQLRSRDQDTAPGKQAIEGMDPLLMHVTAPADFAPLAAFFLGNTFVVPNINRAAQLFSRNGFHGTLVTPDGDMMTPQGILCGGGTKGKERSLLQDRREIAELQEELKQVSHELRAAQTSRERISSLLNGWQEKRHQLSQEIHRAELRLNDRKKDGERLQAEQSNLNRMLQTLEYNQMARKREEEKLLEERDKAKRDVDAATAKEVSITGELEALQKRLNEATQARELAETELTRLRVDVAAREEKHRALLRERDRLTEEMHALNTQLQKTNAETAHLQETLTAWEAELDQKKTSLASLRSELVALEKEMAARGEKREELHARLQETEERLHGGKNSRGELDRRYRDVTAQVREVRYEMDTLERTVMERYETNVAEESASQGDLSGEEIALRQEKLSADRRTLEGFGEVNLLALEEYAGLKERYDFLTSQANDLHRSIEALKRTISRINHLSRERFSRTFAEVNACFQQIFTRVFPGGKGEMVLTDESDMLETGVDIEIKLPGKKLQHIGLLSGGEKAMAALCFVLAFILYRPTPFIVMDEVDAALDDSNINLFIELIKDISAHCQVIIITHNKLSMEAAQHLYGVTMGKKGVSTVISVSLQ